MREILRPRGGTFLLLPERITYQVTGLRSNHTEEKPHSFREGGFPKEVFLPLTWNGYQGAQVIKNPKVKGKSEWVIGPIGCNGVRFPPACHLGNVTSNLLPARSTKLLPEQAFSPRFKKLANLQSARGNSLLLSPLPP
jgi:hypothetical protein